MKNKIVKFRAYSHKYKDILEIESIRFNDKMSKNKNECNVFIGVKMTEWLDEGTFDLLQFSGIKDKHGNEIFEGHIIHDLTKDLVFAIHWIENGLRFGKTIIIGSGKGQTTSLSDLYNDISETPDICADVEIIGDVFTKN